MKLLTLNTHSLLEENYEQKTRDFVAAVIKERPDILALQEVNQSVNAKEADQELLEGYVPYKENKIPVRLDNHAAQVALLLRQAGIFSSWTWIPAKLGYGKYDEGMAIFSLNSPITEVDSFYISRGQDYENWKTRKVLGVRVAGSSDWFYTVHMGWWDDAEEPFEAQWNVLRRRLDEKKETGHVWLMGDFNSPAEVRNEGYDCVLNSGWKDTWMMAKQKDSAVTVKGVIDGWREKLKDCSEEITGMRIDYIWCSEEIPVDCSSVIFNGEREPVVSDHFGVMIQYKKGV